VLGLSLWEFILVTVHAGDTRRCDIMKRIAYFTMLTALLLSLFIPSLAAGGVRATKSDDDVNEEDAEKSDYHVTLVSDTRMSNAKGTLRQGGKRYIGEVDYSEDGRTVTIEWTGLKVANGKKVNWRSRPLPRFSASMWKPVGTSPSRIPTEMPSPTMTWSIPSYRIRFP
jgi:hypothetical protein